MKEEWPKGRRGFFGWGRPGRRKQKKVSLGFCRRASAREETVFRGLVRSAGDPNAFSFVQCRIMEIEECIDAFESAIELHLGSQNADHEFDGVFSFTLGILRVGSIS